MYQGTPGGTALREQEHVSSAKLRSDSNCLSFERRERVNDRPSVCRSDRFDFSHFCVDVLRIHFRSRSYRPLDCARVSIRPAKSLFFPGVCARANERPVPTLPAP
jgi:hypothetical protein